MYRSISNWMIKPWIWVQYCGFLTWIKEVYAHSTYPLTIEMKPSIFFFKTRNMRIILFCITVLWILYAHSTYLLTIEMKKWLENNKAWLFLLKVLYTQYNTSSIREKNTDCTGKLTCTGKWNFDRLRTVYPQFSL